LEKGFKFGRSAGAWIESLARGAGAVAALSILAMCLLISVDVFSRSALEKTLIWVPEIVGYLMVALVFLALGETMLAGSNIRIDLLINRLQKRPRDILELLTLTLSTGIAGFFAWHALNVMLRSLQFGRRDAFGALGTPLYIPQAALPIGLSILTLVLIVLVCRKLCVVLYNAKEGDGGSAAQNDRYGA
jgi:TRAP-type C4-dicarboxylate transport system permease small subunit